MTDLPCPCGHGPDLACLNGKIYGPCGNEGCDTPCDDNHGRCQSLDGCCDPESNVGRILTAGVDPEPPPGTMVRDANGDLWVSYEDSPCVWMQPGVSGAELGTWTRIAGNYGPVTVLEWGNDD